MKTEITYHWGNDHLLIKLGNRIEPRIRILFFIEFLVTSGLATIFLQQSLPLSISYTHWIAGMGSATLYILAAYRLLSRLFFQEQLVLSKHDFIIIHKTPFWQHSRQYDWRSIGPLHYAGRYTKTDHPLKGRNFDYFGFETHEHLIQKLHHGGNMYFDYIGYPVYFARGVYSWDAEEMVHIMKLYAGASLLLGPEWANMLQEQEIDNA